MNRYVWEDTGHGTHLFVDAKPVKRVRDSNACECEECGIIGTEWNPYWDHTKTRHMHERGTGHKVWLVSLSFTPEEQL